MESDPPRWRLWDFGSVQFVQDTVSGESLRAHGDGAAFTDGPFRLSWCGDKPVLVGLEGDEDHCALHRVDEAMVNVITIEEHGEFKEEIYKVSQRCGDKPARPLRDLQIEKSMKNLEIGVEGCAPFKASFAWYSAPSLCGDKPVSVWLAFPWLVEYTMGRAAVPRLWRKAEALQTALKVRGFSSQHCRSSLLSRQRKRARKSDEDAVDDLEGSHEWQVSIIGAIVFLFELLGNRKIKHLAPCRGDKPDERNSGEKTRRLLTALLSWPLREKCFAIVAPRGECEMILDDLVVSLSGEPAAKSQRGRGSSHAGACRRGIVT